MSDDDSRLVVDLEARVAEFEKNFKKASETANTHWSAIESRGKQAASRIQADMNHATAAIASSFTALGSSLAGGLGLSGVLGASGLLALMVKINGELAKIQGLAKRAELSTDRLQEVKYAANIKGVSNDDFATGMDSSLKLLDEAQRQVNDLKRLFNANGMSIKNQNGDLLKFDELLERGAKLMAGAHTEQAKARIAEMLGLSRDWIRVLDGGPEAFKKSAQEAHNVGAVIDSDVIAKAKEFDKAWNVAVVKFKAGMVEALTDLAAAFGKFWADVVDGVPGASFIRDTLERWGGGLRGMTIPELKEAIEKSIEQGLGDFEVARLQAELDRRLGKTPLRITVTPLPSEQATVIPKEHERNPFERAEFETKKRIAVMGAETDAIGKVNEARERAKLIAELEEAAKKANTQAGFQSAIVTDDQREKINKLADAMEAAGRKQRLAEAQFHSFNSVLQMSGDIAVSFVEKLGDRTAKLNDLVISAFATLKKAAIQAALLGSGPLAGLLGTTSSVAGGTGGIFGALGKLFGGSIGGAGAAGGSDGVLSGGIGLGQGGIGHNAAGTDNWKGGPSWVGENGPEVMNVPKGAQIIPNHQLGGRVSNVTHINNVTVAASGGRPQDNQDLADKVGRAMQDHARTMVAAEIRTAMKPGGMLRQ
jgi:hypothetical protein